MKATNDLEMGLRALIVSVIRDEVRRAVNDAVKADEFLSTTAAADVADVAPATIRRWVSEGKLTRHQAGRVIRVSRAELEQLLRDSGASNDELTPEQLADKAFG